ncbi:MAG: murein biosynthesis integral membrane protein MurJ [Chloroflexi bacterium]|nr:murein biosynthesis integral membrane protein MurJ [Chloroflexota bacterium]
MESKTELRPTDAPSTAAPAHTGRKIAVDTLIVMAAFGTAKAISLIQTFVIARVFGVGSEWDAYVTANRIPELIFTLIAGGALAHAFIPIFGGYLARGDKPGAWRTASHVINTIFVTTLAISVIAFIVAPWLVGNVVASGFDDATRQQTTELMRILLLSTLIFSVSGIVMGILQSHNHFLLPALAPIMFDVGILFGVLVLLPLFGVHGIALGAVIGAALHFGIQVPGLIRFRARWHAELGLRDPALWQVIRLMLPRIVGLGVFSFNFIIMNNIASRLGTGSVAALDWGWRLMQIPQTLIGTAMGTVIFPTLAALSAVGNESGKRDAMSGAVRFILIATIPSSIGLVVVGRPMISLLERGAFDASASALVFSTLQFFTLGLITHSLLEVIARSFYADKDTVTPLYAALGGAAINLILSFALSGVAAVESSGLLRAAALQYPQVGLDAPAGNVGGLALANSLGVTFEVLVLLVVLRRRWHGIDESAIGATLLKALVASLVMAAAVVAVGAVWTAIAPGTGFAVTLLQLALQVAAGGLVFIIMAFLLRIDELRSIIAMVRRPQATGAPA